MKSRLELTAKEHPESERFDLRTDGGPGPSPNADPEYGCGCDRWGHPCPDCRNRKQPAAPAATVFPETTTKR